MSSLGIKAPVSIRTRSAASAFPRDALDEEVDSLEDGKYLEPSPEQEPATQASNLSRVAAIVRRERELVPKTKRWDQVMPYAGRNENAGLQHAVLQRRVDIGRWLLTFPEDDSLLGVQQPSTTLDSQHHAIRRVVSQRKPFPPELLNCPRSTVAPIANFSADEDAALLIWMVRAYHGKLVPKYQSPALWHWAEQYQVTKRSWQSMKGHAKKLESYLHAAKPLPSDVMKELDGASAKYYGYFEFNIQNFITGYNAAKVDDENSLAKNAPDVEQRLQNLMPAPDATPWKKKLNPIPTTTVPGIQQLSPVPVSVVPVVANEMEEIEAAVPTANQIPASQSNVSPSNESPPNTQMDLTISRSPPRHTLADFLPPRRPPTVRSPKSKTGARIKR